MWMTSAAWLIASAFFAIRPLNLSSSKKHAESSVLARRSARNCHFAHGLGGIPCDLPINKAWWKCGRGRPCHWAVFRRSQSRAAHEAFEMPPDTPVLSTPISPLIVVPCLNEVRHIASLLTWLIRVQSRVGGQIVVADGGSHDGTLSIVKTLAAKNASLHLIDNPDRVQSSAVNRAVEVFGKSSTHLIRIDAHAVYPEDYCEVLLLSLIHI